MRHFAAMGLLLALPSCSPAEPTQVETARAAFQDWMKALAEADSARTFRMMSDANKSQWLYERLEENDPPARRWRGDMSERGKADPKAAIARTDLDLWWAQAHKNGNGRDEPLPETVLEDPTFVVLWNEYIKKNANALKFRMSRVQIGQIYADDSGVTVAARTGTKTELWGLVYERDGWKVDNYREPQGDVPR